jgi:hypothetical protein
MLLGKLKNMMVLNGWQKNIEFGVEIASTVSLSAYILPMKHKVVIAAVPFIDSHRAMAAPAVLKACLKQHDIDSVALDLNADIVTKLHRHPDRDLFLDFFYKQKIHQNIADEIARMIDHCADQILYHNPTIIALSLFAGDCRVFTFWLCAAIRQRNKNARIVIGGPGLMTLYNGIFNYAETLKRQNLIDDFITGDGEVSIVKYVQGELDYPGINSTTWKRIGDISQMPIPDFTDYSFYRYNEPAMPVIDSRGCVQNCEFCDVIEQWTKFQYKTADKIFSEMLDHIERYKIYRFELRSSVSNGNLKEFKKLIKLIARYNENKFDAEQISWEGSFIVRPASQHNEELWQDLKKSNAFLFMGVESLVDRVRINLGKNFENKDLDHHLEMAQQYQVPVNLLLIAGYPTETLEDYEFSKQWFRDRKHFSKNSVHLVQLTSPTILPGTQLDRTMNKEDFSNPKAVTQRRKQFNDMAQVIQECGFETLLF